MAAFSYSAINASGLELTGELHAPDLAGAREQLRVRGLLANSLNELAASGDDSAPERLQEGQAEDAADLLAPVRDDDRGRPERRRARS